MLIIITTQNSGDKNDLMLFQRVLRNEIKMLQCIQDSCNFWAMQFIERRRRRRAMQLTKLLLTTLNSQLAGACHDMFCDASRLTTTIHLKCQIIVGLKYKSKHTTVPLEIINYDLKTQNFLTDTTSPLILLWVLWLFAKFVIVVLSPIISR